MEKKSVTIAIIVILSLVVVSGIAFLLLKNKELAGLQDSPGMKSYALDAIGKSDDQIIKEIDEINQRCIEDSRDRDIVCISGSLDDVSKCGKNYSCQSEFYLLKATREKDESYCEKVSEETKKECIAFATKNIGLCVQSGYGDENYCRGVILGDTESCKKSSEEASCMEQYYIYQSITNGMNLCENINYDYMKYWCLALFTKNPDHCNTQVVRNCDDAKYFRLGKNINTSYCNSIVYEELRNSCNVIEP